MNGRTQEALIRVLSSSLRQIGLTVDDVLLTVNHCNDIGKQLQEEKHGDQGQNSIPLPEEGAEKGEEDQNPSDQGKGISPT
jgi:hypothetical protein